MKHTRNAYTLVEVLLVVGILGILAAITMPLLMKLRQPDGAILGRAVEQIELGCQNMLQDYNVNSGSASIADKLSAMDGDFTFNLDNLLPYIGAFEKVRPYKQNPIYQFNKFHADFYSTTKENDTNVLAIAINTSGETYTGTTKEGRNTFVFDLTDEGKLIPHGLDKNTCDGDKPEKIDKNCTARVVKDGFKITY